MTDLRQRQPRVENKKHLAFIRTLPCIVCFRHGPSDPAHIRAASAAHDKRWTGKGEKPSDCWTLPLCRGDHDDQHHGKELDFWDRHGIDPFETAAALFAVSGDYDAAMKIIRSARA